MISQEITDVFKAYISDKSDISFAEVQYNLKISYRTTKELMEFASRCKWITSEDEKITVNGAKLKPESFTAAKCKRIAKLMDAPKLALVDRIIEKGSLSRSDAVAFLRSKGQMRFMAETSIDLVVKQEIAYIIDGVIYPSINKDTAIKIREAFDEAN